MCRATLVEISKRHRITHRRSRARSSASGTRLSPCNRRRDRCARADRGRRWGSPSQMAPRSDHELDLCRRRRSCDAIASGAVVGEANPVGEVNLHTHRLTLIGRLIDFALGERLAGLQARLCRSSSVWSGRAVAGRLSSLASASTACSSLATAEPAKGSGAGLAAPCVGASAGDEPLAVLVALAATFTSCSPVGFGCATHPASSTRARTHTMVRERSCALARGVVFIGRPVRVTTTTANHPLA